MISLDKEFVQKVKSLQLDLTKEEPQPELLLKISNSHGDTKYQVDISTREFTSLCPLNLSQPDYAVITVRYIPDKWCVELKSLKFYLVSFRMVQVFHESVPPLILRALVDLLKPRYIEVIGQFSTRGGLDTTVRAVHGNPNW